MTDCPICCEEYNKSVHFKVVCPFDICAYASCKQCTRTYLLGTTREPHCMSCNKAWDQKFLVENLNQSFCKTEYKKHRQNLLLEHELSKLQDTMHAVQKYKDVKSRKVFRKELMDEKDKMKDRIAELQELINVASREIYRLETGNVDAKVKKTFIMPCQNDDCRGFLSSAYKCDICETFTCHKCLNVLGPNKNVEHTCKESDVKSAELIRKETKPCPTCGLRISKVSGCSQMWCTECHTAFNWQTGVIEKGTVHNPHFYEYQRRTNGGVAPRNPGDVPCGGLINWHQMSNIKKSVSIAIQIWELEERFVVGSRRSRRPDRNLCSIIDNLHRCMAHIIIHELPEIRVRALNTVRVNETLRVQYIVKEITKDRLSELVYRRDYQRRKNNGLLHIYELISAYGIDMFRELTEIEVKENLSNTKRTESYMKNNNAGNYLNIVNKKIDEFHQLRVYCNEQLAIISASYGCQMPVIDEHFKITKEKTNMSILTNKGKGKTAANIVISSSFASGSK